MANAPKPAVVSSVIPSAPGANKAVLTPVTSPAFKIEALEVFETYLKILVYGKYGIGKTHLAGTASMVPQMQDIIIIDAEGGTLTLSEMSGIDVIRVKNLKQVGRIYEFLKLHCELREQGNKDRMIEIEAILRDVDKKTIKEPKQYRTVIVDSFTEVETYSMYQLLGITERSKLDDEFMSAEWAEYKKNFNAMQLMARQFRDLEMHVIMTCSATFFQNDLKETSFHPNLTGKLSRAVQGFFDMVGFLSIGQNSEGENVRRLYVQPSGSFDAKNRFAVFQGAHFDNPTMESILKAVGLYKS